MQIQKTNYSYTPNFRAIKIASTKNFVNNLTIPIDIYKINPKTDNIFLKNWQKKVDFKKLFPQMPEFDSSRIKRIFDYTINSAAGIDYTTYVAISNNKPCGIISYIQSNQGNTFIDGLCSIPIEINKKVRKTGSTLLLQTFKDASKNNSKEIVLDAVNNGPFNIIRKYEAFGFKKYSISNDYTNMRCNKYKREEQIRQFERDIEYIPENLDENTDLNQFID